MPGVEEGRRAARMERWATNDEWRELDKDAAADCAVCERNRAPEFGTNALMVAWLLSWTDRADEGE